MSDELNPHIHVWLDDPKERLGELRPGEPFLEIVVDSEGDTTVKKEVLEGIAEKIEANAKGLDPYAPDFIDRIIKLVGSSGEVQVGVKRPVMFEKHNALISPTKKPGSDSQA